MPTVITCYPPTAGSPAPAPAPAPGTRVLLRAAVPDGAFGSLAIAEFGDAGAAAEAVAAERAEPTALAGTYEAFHVNDRPAEPFAADEAHARGSSVVFVNCLEFAPGGHDAAFALWAHVNEYMVAKPGYRWHRLHRRLGDDAPFGLVNVVEWESVDAWRAAHDAGFRERAIRPDMPFVARPTLCLPVEGTVAMLRTARTA